MILLTALLLTAPPLHAEGVPMIPADFSTLAETASPSVVNIRTEKRINGGGPVSRHFQSPNSKDPMNELFDRFFGDQRQREFKQRSLGTGFIIDAEGYIVTNNHVVENTDEITVILKDGQEYEATIVGRDPSTDLALIKIDAKEALPALAFGDSEKAKVGQWVMAIGNPFGLGHTVTTGIVSAKGRVLGNGPYDDYLQTDTSINPGNSGGPLLDLNGRVIGINTAIIKGGQGLGFSIPINLAAGIIAQLKAEGNVTRGWIGVSIQEIQGEVAKYYGLSRAKGVLVMEAFEGDPAYEAGIRAKDVIIAIAGQAVVSMRDLTGIIAAQRVGDRVRVTLLRGDKEKTVKVTVGKREERRTAGARGVGSGDADLGIDIVSISPEIARRYKLGDNMDGVLITGVKPLSKGSQAGLIHGDIIKEINHTPVKSEDGYFKIMEAVKPGAQMDILIVRQGRGYALVRLVK